MPKKRGRPPKKTMPPDTLDERPDEISGNEGDIDEVTLDQLAPANEPGVTRRRLTTSYQKSDFLSDPEERGSAHPLPHMEQPAILTDGEKSIASSVIGSLPSIKDSIKDVEDGLSHTSNSQKIIEVLDHMHGYGGNIFCFVDNKGKPLDKGAKILQKQGKIPSVIDMQVDEIHEFPRQKNKRYFLVCLENEESAYSLHIQRIGIHQALTLLKTLMTSLD